MAVEIKELLIRTHVTGSPRDSMHPEALQALRQDILAQCQRLVQDALQRQHER